MNQRSIILSFLACSSTTIAVVALQAKPKVSWPYDPSLRPISRQEIRQIIRSSKPVDLQKTYLLPRAASSGLLEDLVVECSIQLKTKRHDPTLTGLYCSALFLSQDPTEYNAQNEHERLRQQNTLTLNAGMTAESLARSTGSKNVVCLRAYSYFNLTGAQGGVPEGVRLAQEALLIDPNDLFTNRLLAYAYLKEGSTNSPAKALVYARKAAQIEPKLESAYAYQAAALFQLKQYNSAYRMLLRAETLLPPHMRNARWQMIKKMYLGFAKSKNSGSM